MILTGGSLPTSILPLEGEHRSKERALTAACHSISIRSRQKNTRHQHSPLFDLPLIFKHTTFSTPSLSPNPQLPMSLVYFLQTFNTIISPIIEARVTTSL